MCAIQTRLCKFNVLFGRLHKKGQGRHKTVSSKEFRKKRSGNSSSARKNAGCRDKANKRTKGAGLQNEGARLTEKMSKNGVKITP